jgi:hypothetical protein
VGDVTLTTKPTVSAVVIEEYAEILDFSPSATSATSGEFFPTVATTTELSADELSVLNTNVTTDQPAALLTSQEMT